MTYHIDFDHPNWRHLAAKPYKNFLDAVCAYDALGLPDGPTRIVDETGLVWAVLHMPPVEPTPDETGVIESLVQSLRQAEDDGVFDRSEFFGALKEVRVLLDGIERRGRALYERQHNARRPHLLVVDDDPVVRRAIERRALAIGFQVTTTSTLRDLRNSMAAIPFPHVVVADYDLPDGTGTEVQDHIIQAAERRREPAPIMIAHSSSSANLSRMRGARVLKGLSDELDGELRTAHDKLMGTFCYACVSSTHATSDCPLRDTPPELL